ncbi:class I tRNA ligase family protein [Clostridium sp. 'White wine YQ']|uniref:class I tRNA ligase family protein n=1 Tax=Clostridium sp. 'White wine YQ' TaxID=3027474 RepID=UPI00236729E5|nr:class I tRNA ligase family protein [Clostridium sp. 'White wine YQ']MDD7794253.1 class I tRNA ligase family protein [Clostridium sp. 'White wine YQ']
MEDRKIERPVFPKKAVITSGMPYGNKELHFGHVGGVFVHADTFARFLRDRIGSENVIFVSGTDCYGSPILASYRKIVDEGEYSGTIEDYVRENHEKQKEVLDKYEMSLNLYGASALDRAGEIHKEVSENIFNKLYEGGYLVKLSSPQFYDPDKKVLLNGRQVVGKCPIEGCASEKGYADECDLGHQYMPSELIDPKSILSGKTPELKDVTNWYFKLDEYNNLLNEDVNYLRNNSNWRKYLLNTIEEFLKPPIIYVKRKLLEGISDLEDKLPKHTIIDEPKKPSISFVFDNLNDRDKAREVFDKLGIRFRTGKTLVPFRLSGNVEWGIEVPEKEDLKDLTFWVWPESLWAPISFTKTYLESIGKDKDSWKNFWISKDSKVYQFIGEDNIYFYGNAEMAMALALLGINSSDKVEWENVNLPHLIANNHLLFMDKKASSSGKVKPPMARELLNHYTAEQLRMHFLSLGLVKKSVSFMPQAFMKEEDKQGPDTVLKDGNLLTNVFNRLARSCFYTAQKYYESNIPVGEISKEILDESRDAILTYERYMYNHEFHSVTYVLDSYIRKMNKYWVNNMRIAETSGDEKLRKQVLIDAFHAVRTTLTLIHPIAPNSSELLREYLNVNNKLWSWDYIFEPIYKFIDETTKHRLKYLETREDFFEKHESQFAN